jgi:beta-galactosidase
VDVLPSRADLRGYAMVVLPAHMREDAGLAQRMAESGAHIVLGPRSGSKSASLAIPEQLAPGAFSALAGVQVQRVESLPPGLVEGVQWVNGPAASVARWREDLALTGAVALAKFEDGKPAVTRHGNTWYSAGWMDSAGWRHLLGEAAHAASLPTLDLPADVRISRRGDWVFALNFSSSTVDFSPSTDAQCLLGARALAPQAVSIWKLKPSA